jgi:hypothetical protein
MPPEKAAAPRLRSDDVDEIFAWLDSGIARGFGYEWFEQTIVEHLSRTCHKDFTWEQIDQKIYDTCRQRGGYNDFARVYDIGTKAFTSYKFSHETDTRFQARVKQLIKEHADRSLEPSQIDGGIKTTGQSISVQVPTCSSPRLKRRRTETPSNGLPVGSKRESITLQRNNSRNSDIGTTRHSPTIGSKAPSALSKAPENVVPDAISDNERSEDPSSTPASSTNSVAEDSLIPDESYQNINPEGFPKAAKNTTQQSSMRLPARISMRSAENNSPCDLIECEIMRQLLADREREVQYLRLESAKDRDFIKTLERELECEKQTYAISMKDGGSPNEETLKSYLNEIDILRSQLEDKETLSPFTTQTRKKHIPFDEKYFQKNMNRIRYVMEEFMCNTDTSRMCKITLESQTEDLRLLFRRVFGESGGTLRSLSFHSILRSFLSAAVCEWVLECDLQEHWLASTPWREAALSHLVTQGMWYLNAGCY